MRVTSPLAAVARKHALSEDALAAALDAALAGASPAALKSGDTTDVVEQALSAAVMLTDALTLGEVAERLGIPEFEVSRYAAAGDLHAVTVADGADPLFPAWQFTDTTEDGVLPYLGAILHRLPGEVSPLAITRWMTTPHPALRVEDGVVMSPRVWLLYVGDLGVLLDAVDGFEASTK